MQQVDDPPYLSVGTEVSAKYKGAFCEAKVRKVDRNIKCKVAYKQGLGSGTVSDDQIKGDQLRVGALVEVRHPDRKDYVEAVITKIQDSSQYTVVFDDGDITTLRRSALCLKSGRHFNESETLDQLPLTHPEHFGNPVIGGRRGGRRSRHMPEDSSDDDDDNAALMPHGTAGGGSGGAAGVAAAAKRRLAEKEEHIGKVVCVENTDTKKKSARESRETWFPALVVAPTAQDAVRIRVKDEYLVRSFKDGRYYTVPKKEATEFRRDKHTAKHAQPSDAVQAALEYLLADELPAHWDREQLFAVSADRSSASDAEEDDSETSDDEPREEKDHFVAQLYKYMDDRGTPLNKGPSIANRDVDLYRLFRAVQKLNGYNKVTGQSQWKQIATRLGYAPVTQSIQNLVKQAYKKFLLPFEEFDRKLGCTMVAHPRANRIKGRNLLRANSVASPKLDRECKASSIVASTSTVPAAVPGAPADAESSESTSASSVESGPESVTVRAKRQLSTGSAASGKVRALVDKYEDKLSKEVVAALAATAAAVAADSGDDDMPVPLATIAMAVKLEESQARDKLQRNDAKRAREAAKESAKELLKDIKLEKVDPEVAAASASSAYSAHSVSSRLSGSKLASAAGLALKDEPSIASTHRSPSAVPGSHAQVPPNSGSSSARKDKQPKRPMPPSTPTQQSTSDDGRKTTGGPLVAAVGGSAKKRRSEVDGEKMLTSAVAAVTGDPNDFPIEVGDKLKVFYHEQKTTYEAKVIEISVQLGTAHYLVHYTGWNTRYDEWVPKERIAENLTNNRTNKKAKTGGAPSISKDKFIAAAAAAAASTTGGQHGAGGSTAAATASASSSTSSSTSSLVAAIAASAASKTLFKRNRGSSRGESQPPRSTTPSSVASNSSRTKSPATPATVQRRTARLLPSSSSSVRRTSNNTDISSLQTDDSDTDSDEPVKKPTAGQQAAHAVRRLPAHIPRGNSLPATVSTMGGGGVSAAQQQRASRSPSVVAITATAAAAAAAATAAAVTAAIVGSAGSTVSTPSLKSTSTASSVKSGGGSSSTKTNSNASSEEESSTAARTSASQLAASAAAAAAKGRDFDLKQIRSELKGLKGQLKSAPAAKRTVAEDGDADDDDDEDNDDDDEEEEEEATPDDIQTPAVASAAAVASQSPDKAKTTPLPFSDCPSSASNSDNLSDDHRTAKPTVSSDSGDSEASDSFGDDDSQFSDKTTTLDNLTERLQEKYQSGRLHTDVFKKAPASTVAAIDRPTEKVVAPSKLVGTDKNSKQTLADRTKTPAAKLPTTKVPTAKAPAATSTTITTTATADRTTVKLDGAASKITPAEPVSESKSPNKSRVVGRSLGDKSHFAERNRAAAAAAAAAIAAEKATKRDLSVAGSETSSRPIVDDAATITTTPKKSGVVVAAAESSMSPKVASTGSAAAGVAKDECDVYEFKEPEPFEFEAVKKISPESDKKAKKKSFAESVADKLSTSPLSSTSTAAATAAAGPSASKRAKKSPAKPPPTVEAERPDKYDKLEKKPSPVTPTAAMRPLDVDTNTQQTPPAPMSSPPMIFSPTVGAGRPESIFDSLRKSPCFNLAQLAAQQNERDELESAGASPPPPSTALTTAVIWTDKKRLPIAITQNIISCLGEPGVSAPTPWQPSLITPYAAPAVKPDTLSVPVLPFISVASTSPSTSAPIKPINASSSSFSSSTSSSSFASTSASATSAGAGRPKLPRPPSEDTLKAFVSGPATSDNEDDSTVLQLQTAKQILLAGSVYEAPPQLDKPSSIADKVLKALNMQKCAAEAAAAAAAAAVSTTTTVEATTTSTTTTSTTTTTTLTSPLRSDLPSELALSSPLATTPLVPPTGTSPSEAIVPGSSVPVSTAASVALTVATAEVRSRTEVHTSAAAKPSETGANKPILNSPDNSKQFSMDETKNQELSDTIKKLRGVVQPTDADRRFVDDSDDSTGSERMAIEDGDSLMGPSNSHESSLSGFERISSPKLTPAATEKLDKEPAPKTTVIARKAPVDAAVSKDNRRSGGESKEIKKAAVKRPAEAKKSEARKSIEPKETIQEKLTADSIGSLARKPVEPVKTGLELKPTQLVTDAPVALKAVHPNAFPIIRIEPMPAVPKTASATAVPAMPMPVAVTAGGAIKSAPSLADLNKLAPRVFASIMPLPEATKPTVVVAGLVQQQHVHALSRTHSMPSTIILNTMPPAPPLVPLSVRHDAPLVAATTIAATAAAAVVASTTVNVTVSASSTAAVAERRPTAEIDSQDDDDADDDDDDLNDFDNDKLVIVTKDDEDDEEDDDDDEDAGNNNDNDADDDDHDAEDEDNGTDDDRLATEQLSHIATISIESSDPSASADSSPAIGVGPSSSKPLSVNPSGQIPVADADAQQQQHTQQKESLSLLMCEETIPGSPCPKEPTSGGNDTNTEDDEELAHPAVAAAATKATTLPKKRKSSAESAKNVVALVAATAPATGTHHVHPTGSNMKSVPMDLEPSTVTKTTSGGHAGMTMPTLAKVTPVPTLSTSQQQSATPVALSKSDKSLTVSATRLITAVPTSALIAPRQQFDVPAAAVIPSAVNPLLTPTLPPPPAAAAAAALAAVVQQPALMAVSSQLQPQRRDSFSNDDSDDVRKNVDQLFADNRKRRRSKKASESEASATAATTHAPAKRRKNTSRRNTVTGSESDDNGEYGSTPKAQRSGPAKPCQYNFLVQLDPTLNSHQRISVIHKKIQDLRKTYNHLKGELASIDRRRKKLRRRDRETKKLKQRQIDCGGAT